MAKTSFILISFFLLVSSSEELPAQKAESVARENFTIFGENFAMRQVGQYLDPVTNIFKRYYTDVDPSVTRTWANNKAYCQSLDMEPVSPLSYEEVRYIITGTTITCTNYWTSGIQQWFWDIQTTIPVYNPRTWCTSPDPPTGPQCAGLHKGGGNLHALDCATVQCTLCEHKV